MEPWTILFFCFLLLSIYFFYVLLGLAIVTINTLRFLTSLVVWSLWFSSVCSSFWLNILSFTVKFMISWCDVLYLFNFFLLLSLFADSKEEWCRIFYKLSNIFLPELSQNEFHFLMNSTHTDTRSKWIKSLVINLMVLIPCEMNTIIKKLQPYELQNERYFCILYNTTFVLLRTNYFKFCGKINTNCSG